MCLLFHSVRWASRLRRGTGEAKYHLTRGEQSESLKVAGATAVISGARFGVLTAPEDQIGTMHVFP